MFHPTQREMIEECFDTQLLRWLSLDEIDRLLKEHKPKYQYMCDLYVKAFEAERPDQLKAARSARDKLIELFNHENIVNWMNTDKLITLTGEEIVIRLSGQAVLNYLTDRNSVLDFTRDKLEVIIESGKVVVKICDKVSGGSTTHVSDLDIYSFEAEYNKVG